MRKEEGMENESDSRKRMHRALRWEEAKPLGIGKKARGAGAQRAEWVEEWPGWAWGWWGKAGQGSVRDL